MKLVDANVLIYAINQSDPRHDEARDWLDGALSESETVGFSWGVLLAFIRLVTKAALFPHPMTTDEAVSAVRRWLDQPSAVTVEPSSRHLDVLSGLLAQYGSGGNLVSDAHLAALAVEHDATIVSYDQDFSRFTGVRVEAPRA